MKPPDFWQSSGARLLDRGAGGRLQLTPAFAAAYLARPEMAPVEESCTAELALHQALLEEPLQDIADEVMTALADEDAQDNYRTFLGFRDVLRHHASIEEAYLAIVSGKAEAAVPALFVDQLVHVILRSILEDNDDPIRARAGELFFREQNVSTENGLIMLADHEVVEMHASAQGMGGLGQLLAENATPQRRIDLDVLDEENAEIYWQRSDRFDTVIDIRFTQPSLDALARVMEAWIKHFHHLDTRIQPVQRIDDEKWRWHIGLDAQASELLNMLYNGEEVEAEMLAHILALFRMEIDDKERIVQDLRGRPVYLAIAKTPAGTLKMKPQNLLLNLPLEKGL